MLLVALAPSLAAAEGAPRPLDSGLVFGARAGYGVPFGDVGQGGPAVGNLVARELPLAIDVGYRFNPYVWGELFLELSPAWVDAESCAPGVSCSAWDGRFGLEAQFHLAPRHGLDPWLGIGFGLEILNATVWDASLAGLHEWTWTGIEFPLVEAGLEIALSQRLSVGPYAAVSLAEFTSVSQRPPGGATKTGSVEERAPHGWFRAGAKFTLRL